MRIQAKLFLLLLVIAVVPLVALSWRGERATENLGLAVAEHGKAAEIAQIEDQLRQTVASASDVIASQRRQVELAVRLQGAEVERRLGGDAPADDGTPIYLHTAFDDPQSWPPGTELALDHAISSPGREMQAVPISRDHQAFLLAPDADPKRANELMRRLASLNQVYRQVGDTNPNLFYWQYVSLKDGVSSAYPGHGGYPVGFDPRKRAWYTAAAEAGELVWTPPLLDASTRRLLLTASLPVRAADQTLAGVTGIDVDILTILNGVHARLRLGADAESYIVQLSDAQGASYVAGETQGPPELRVIASSTYHDSGTAWDAMLETPVLKSGTPTGVDTIAADLMAGRDGILQMPHKGRDAMWVYGHVEGLPLGLLYIVPVDEIEIIADQAQESVRQAIVDQVRLAGIATVALTILVAVLSMLAARSVTSPLRELAATAHGLAQGNLEARATVSSSDEVGELATVFNAMVPELRQHIQVKESLALAREVQQKLLPEKAPLVAGFDIAGSSIYSEDVGGDYYDFIELADEAGERHLGIVVGDVAGHGIVAALTMTSVRVLLRSHAGDGTGLKSVIRAVNRHLSEDATAGRFVTLVYMILDPDTRELRWVNAGHGPIFLYDPAQDTFTEMGAHDIPLGVKPDWQYQEQSRQEWPAGAVLVIGTDGIWEAQNPEGRAFGRDGMKHVIRSTARAPAAEICKAMEERLKEFSDGVPQRDDVTLVVVKFP
ncbi:MAG: SpoIIE family protein phosphatase [Rhodospirillaceae bacterium]|nr:SpoIIE family protein phosphatase [Rhodospirillaceae bacterium]